MNMFFFDDHHYAVTKVNAIADVDAGNEDKRQDALLIERHPDDVKFVLFGFNMPESKEEFLKVLPNAFGTTNAELSSVKTFKFIDYWNYYTGVDRVEMVEIDGTVYALSGWGGEAYEDCWECLDAFTIGEENICIRPIWEEVDEDDFELAGYEIL